MNKITKFKSVRKRTLSNFSIHYDFSKLRFIFSENIRLFGFNSRNFPWQTNQIEIFLRREFK